MSLKRNKQIAVGLTALGLSMATFAMDRDSQVFLGIGRALQLMATAFLFIGIFKKDMQHKDKCLLIWLAVSTFLLATYCYVSLNYFADSMRWWEFSTWLVCLFLQWAATAVVAFLLYYMFLEYEELAQNNLAAITTNTSARQEINAVWETKEQPPPYINPTSENVSISILN